MGPASIMMSSEEYNRTALSQLLEELKIGPGSLLSVDRKIISRDGFWPLKLI